MNEREEAAKWVKLGYETYGPSGARAMAKAMGLVTDPGGKAATLDRRPDFTAIYGGAALVDDERDDQPPIQD